MKKQIPNQKCLEKIIERARKSVKPGPPNPKSYDFEIPDQFKTTFSGEKFLLFDSCDDGTGNKDRILLFSTEKNLTILSDSEHWFSDGTFPSWPHLFDQFYAIHAVYDCQTVPLVYALLPDRKKKTYIKMFQVIKSLIKSNVRPKSYTVDFEKESMAAVSIEFPYTRVHGYFFHFMQTIAKQLKVYGFANRYVEDVEFSSQIRKLGALAFLPVDKVVGSFETLLESEYFTENEETLTPVINYFESTWIGSLDRRGKRKAPLFSIEVWNCFGRLESDLHRTDSNVERWHNSMLTLINCTSPNVWNFINAIKRYHSLTSLLKEQLFAEYGTKEKIDK